MALSDDEATRSAGAALMSEGRVLLSQSRWRDREVLRISVSNARTSIEDVAAVVDAVGAALDARTAR